MFHWELLKKTALLGTEKMPLQIETLPIPIQEVLSKSHKNDAEGYFLKAAALLYTYSRAGQNPAKITLPGMALAEGESRLFCPPEIVSLWKKLLDLSPLNPYLSEYLIRRCIHKQWVLTDDLLVRVLNNSPKQSLTQVHQILGVRGRWLTQFNEAWQLTKSTQTEWNEGKPGERKAFLLQLRSEQPAEALALLQQTWPNESAKERKNLLMTLSVNLSPSDESFLNQVHDELYQSSSPLKPVTLETIQLINELRLKINGSAFGNEVAEKITNCIVKKKGVLSVLGLNEGSYQLLLPDSDTDFWNGAEMNQRFGFDKLSSQKGVSDAEYWLHSLLRWLHPSHLLAFFGGSITKMVTFFANVQPARAQNAPAYIYALSEAMTLANPDEIKIFLEQTAKTDIKAGELLRSLEWPEQEKLLLRHFDLNLSLVKTLTSESPQQNWSETFSLAVLRTLVKETQQANYYHTFSDKDFINRLGRKLHTNTKEVIFQLQSELSQDWQKSHWNNHFAEPVFKQLTIKEEIEKITIP